MNCGDFCGDFARCCLPFVAVLCAIGWSLSRPQSRESSVRTAFANGTARTRLHVRVLIELSDDEAVAAAVMLPMVAADRRAPSASSHTGGAFKRNARGSSEAILGTAAAKNSARRSPK